MASSDQRGRFLARDSTAASADADLPAFLARPAGAPIYHGFRVLPDVVADGFTFGAITDIDGEVYTEGDAFVIAPDGSRAGLVWEISTVASLRELAPIAADRWGVWAVSFPHPMTSHEAAQRNLAAILPALRPHWERWRQTFASHVGTGSD